MQVLFVGISVQKSCCRQVCRVHWPVNAHNIVLMKDMLHILARCVLGLVLTLVLAQYMQDNRLIKFPSITLRSGPEVIKLFFMLNSTEHEISTALKNKIPTNKKVYCFEFLRCCIYHAIKC